MFDAIGLLGMVPIGIHWSWMSDGLDLYFPCICIVLFFIIKIQHYHLMEKKAANMDS